ncbi:MAG: GGDEF domain-containing protein [Solirubrobacteraceae bacterium]
MIAGFVKPPQDRMLVLWATASYAALIALCVQDPGLLGRLGASRRDGLTGCLTYHATRDELDCEINRSARGDLPLSVCFIDLDDFKKVNDIHGHLLGNEVLAEVAEILRNGVRSFDTVGRYGGDEFVAILPQTHRCSAQALAERLRSQLATTPHRSLLRPLTASTGVAEWVPGTTSEQLLAAADAALLSAKGRRTGVNTARKASATAA